MNDLQNDWIYIRSKILTTIKIYFWNRWYIIIFFDVYCGEMKINKHVYIRILQEQFLPDKKIKKKSFLVVFEVNTINSYANSHID